MVAATRWLATRPIYPLHAVLLASTLPLFLGGLLSDIAYARTYQIQWSNFAAWLIAGAMVFTGLSLLWAVIGFFRRDNRGGWFLVALVLIAAMFVLGLIDSFVHARDAFAVMPTGLVLSAVVTALAAAANWVGFASLREAAR